MAAVAAIVAYTIAFMAVEAVGVSTVLGGCQRLRQPFYAGGAMAQGRVAVVAVAAALSHHLQQRTVHVLGGRGWGVQEAP